MKNVLTAIANFQYECPTILKDTQGYGYKYTDISTIIEQIKPLLKKHKLGFYQGVDGLSLKTVVFHTESGEIVSESAVIPQGVSLKGMNDFQVLGSAITYMRRYQLSAMLGIVTDKDIDGAGEQVKTEFTLEALEALYKAKKSKLNEAMNARLLDIMTNEETGSYEKAIKTLTGL